MAARHFNFSSDDNPRRQNISNALSTLADLSSDPANYGAALEVLGAGLGHRLATRLAGSPHCNVYVVTTPEDLDTLGAGFLAALDETSASVSVACLWISIGRVPLDDTSEPIDVAQIVQEYVEPAPADVDHLAVLTSMPFSVCVLRTMLHRMLDRLAPKTVHVFAPVIGTGMGERLYSEGSRGAPISLQVCTFAVDDDLDDSGNAFPGVGGVSYERLGFANQDVKNSILPQYVVNSIRSRRELKRESEQPTDNSGFTF